MTLNVLKGIDIFLDQLIDCINIFKALHNYMSRCKCTGQDSKSAMGLVGRH